MKIVCVKVPQMTLIKYYPITITHQKSFGQQLQYFDKMNQTDVHLLDFSAGYSCPVIICHNYFFTVHEINVTNSCIQ